VLDKTTTQRDNANPGLSRNGKTLDVRQPDISHGQQRRAFVQRNRYGRIHVTGYGCPYAEHLALGKRNP